MKHPRVYHKYVDPQRFDHDIAAESRIKTYHECKSKNFKTSVLFSINPFNEHYCVSRATPVRCTGLMKTSLHLSQDAVRKEKALKPHDHEHQKAAPEVDEINCPGVSTLGGTIRIPLL